MPRVLLPAAEPVFDPAVEAVAAALTSPEYVYLLRVVEALPVNPNAKMPTVLLPAAAPCCDATVAAVALPLVLLDYVTLLRVVELPDANPKAKIPTVLLPVAEPTDELLEAELPKATTQPE